MFFIEFHLELVYRSTYEYIQRHQIEINLNDIAHVSVFVSNPEMGAMYLMDKRFMSQQSADVAQFLQTRKGLSKKAIGEYISRRSPFNAQVLKYVHFSIFGYTLYIYPFCLYVQFLLYPYTYVDIVTFYSNS